REGQQSANQKTSSHHKFLFGFPNKYPWFDRAPARRNHLASNGRHINRQNALLASRAGACFSAEVSPPRIMGSPSLPAPMITTFELPLRANSFVASIPFHFNRFSLIPSATIF